MTTKTEGVEAASCDPAAGYAPIAGDYDEMVDPQFLSRLFDEQTIRKTGAAYLQKMPGEKDHNKLVGLLAGNSSIAGSSDENEIHQYLEEKIKRDFDEGKTVMLNGWVLSVTEARQCALYSLIKP